LHAAVVTAFNQMIEQKDEFIPGMRLAVELALAICLKPLKLKTALKIWPR
jgi:hypothetical protein